MSGYVCSCGISQRGQIFLGDRILEAVVQVVDSKAEGVIKEKLRDKRNTGILLLKCYFFCYSISKSIDIFIILKRTKDELWRVF